MRFSAGCLPGQKWLSKSIHGKKAENTKRDPTRSSHAKFETYANWDKKHAVLKPHSRVKDNDAGRSKIWQIKKNPMSPEKDPPSSEKPWQCSNRLTASARLCPQMRPGRSNQRSRSRHKK